MQTADHCKVLGAGQTGFSPHHSSSVQEKTPESLLVRRVRSSQPIMWKSNGNVCQMFKLIVASLYSSAAYFQRCYAVCSQVTVGYPQGYLVWDAAMSRGICPRVNSCGSFWILSALIIAANVIDVEAYSCHEVRTAFQLRQVGPLHRVPETPGTGESVRLPPRSEELSGLNALQTSHFSNRAAALIPIICHTMCKSVNRDHRCFSNNVLLSKAHVCKHY